MDEYNYWVTLYSIIFSVLIASLSLNSITLIKDKFNKILAFFVFTGLYSFILSYFFGKAFIGYTQQERLGCVDTFRLKNSEVVKLNRQTQFYYSLCLVPC